MVGQFLTRGFPSLYTGPAADHGASTDISSMSRAGERGLSTRTSASPRTCSDTCREELKTMGSAFPSPVPIHPAERLRKGGSP